MKSSSQHSLKERNRQRDVEKKKQKVEEGKDKRDIHIKEYNIQKKLSSHLTPPGKIGDMD